MKRLLVPLLILPLAACASQEDFSLLHREITDVQRQVQQLGASTLDKTDLAAMQQRFEEQSQAVVRSNADLATKVDRLQEELEAVRASLEVTTRRLQELARQMAAAQVAAGFRSGVPPVEEQPVAPRTTVPSGGEGEAAPAGASQGEGAAAPRPTALPETPEALYRAAYEDYMRGNYELALQGFQEYVKRYPDTDLTDNAHYWIGECYDALGRLDEALAAFSTVLEKYPASDKAAAAQLKKGLVFLKKGDKGQGVINLQYVVYEHPGTKEADLAREKLGSLGITIR
jgi:tol-pal system protein YbgF